MHFAGHSAFVFIVASTVWATKALNLAVIVTDAKITAAQTINIPIPTASRDRCIIRALNATPAHVFHFDGHCRLMIIAKPDSAIQYNAASPAIAATSINLSRKKA